MGTISRIEKLARLHSIIKSGVNSTPFEIAEKIEISVSCLYNYIEELKLYGAEIEYDKLNKKFYYINDFEFKIIIRSEDQELIMGGKSRNISNSKILEIQLLPLS